MADNVNKFRPRPATAFLTPRFLDNRSSGIPPHSGQFIWKYLDMKSGGKSLFCRNLTTVDTLVNTASPSNDGFGRSSALALRPSMRRDLYVRCHCDRSHSTTHVAMIPTVCRSSADVVVSKCFDCHIHTCFSASSCRVMNRWLSWGEVASRAVRTENLVSCRYSTHFQSLSTLAAQSLPTFTKPAGQRKRSASAASQISTKGRQRQVAGGGHRL